MSNIIVATFKKCIRIFNYINHNPTFQPKYRIIEIIEDENDSYTVHTQIINTKLTFHTTPQEILMDDNFVDGFSPRDVRTLTYLGYLVLKGPKFTIMAQRIIENNKVIFAIKQKGQKELIIKKASEILHEQDIISHMSPTDAIKIGYALGSNDFN